MDEDFEIIAVEINSRNHKHTWDIVGLYRAPNDDMRVLERLVDRTFCARNPEKSRIIGGDLNLPRVDWNWNAEGNNPTQSLVNRLVWHNGYSQVVHRPTRGDAILYVYLVRPEISFTSCSIVQGISDNHCVLLEVDWEENFTVPQFETKQMSSDYKPSSKTDFQFGQVTAAVLRRQYLAHTGENLSQPVHHRY